MIVFIIILLILVTTHLIFDRFRFSDYRNQCKERNSRIYILIVSFMLISISGLRGLSVGIDTYAYYLRFNSLKALDITEIFLGLNNEYGFRLFEYIVGRIFGEFQVLLVLVAILYIGAISYIIYKYSLSPLLSYILFIGLGFFTFGMSAIRQTMAIGFTVIAFKYIPKKQLTKFLFFTILASTFHITALIFIPSYWFNKFKLNKKSIFFFAVIALILVIFKGEIREALINLSGKKYASVETGGYKYYFLMVFSLIIGFVYRKSLIEKLGINQYLFFMIIAATIIIPITQFHPAVMRLYYYYSIFLIVYIPNILMTINDKAIRLIGIYGYTATSLILFFTSILSTSRLERYLFFWQ